MKFKCGLTKEEAQEKKDRRQVGHRWFAWRPVTVDGTSHDCRWLEWIERKQRWVSGGYTASGWWQTEYRSIT